MPELTSLLNRRALTLARRRAHWLIRRPTVSTRRPRMFPGALRFDEAEERAAAEAVLDVMRAKRLSRYTSVSGNPLQRSRLGRFERRFADRVGTRHALGVNSGTSALVCALAGLEIGPGDEVIIPAYTWFSTASAVLAVGAVPIVAEVDRSLTLDPSDAERKLSPHTKALLVVHMRGAPADMDALGELARTRGLCVIEDAAQAVGASFRGRALGSIGDAGAYSFEMSKIMTAGEGGMVTTDAARVHRRAAMFHDSAAGPHLGLTAEEWLPGLNLRMSEMHAAVLLVQLERLDRLLADMRKRKLALKQIVAERLERKGVSFRTIHDPAGEAALAMIFFVPDRDIAPDLVRALADQNVPASRLYHDLAGLPRDLVDLHAYPAWAPMIEKRTWSPRGGPWREHAREVTYEPDACPVTIDLLRRAVHVDVSPDLSVRQVEQIGGVIVDQVEHIL